MQDGNKTVHLNKFFENVENEESKTVHNANTVKQLCPRMYNNATHVPQRAKIMKVKKDPMQLVEAFYVMVLDHLQVEPEPQWPLAWT